MPSTYTTSTGVTLGRDAFICHYVAAWLAARSVHVYDDCCSRGDHSRQDKPPVEDALFCAEAAWERIESLHP